MTPRHHEVNTHTIITLPVTTKLTLTFVPSYSYRFPIGLPSRSVHSYSNRFPSCSIADPVALHNPSEPYRQPV